MCFQRNQMFRSSGAGELHGEFRFYKHFVPPGLKTGADLIGFQAAPAIATNAARLSNPRFIHRGLLAGST